jgi:metal transporter CNNM
MEETIIWLGIFLCITQSAMFSGLNLAFFSIPRLRLEIEASNNNISAIKVLSLRKNSNFLLATVLWGNVGINVALTLLSNSVMTGIVAFLFSTVVITMLGEIIPQAYFSKYALKIASKFTLVIKFYQYLLYPVTKPSALLLNVLVGQESIHFFKEKSLQNLIHRHVEDEDAEIDFVEGMGAINFLSLDDLIISNEGEPLNVKSIIPIKHKNGLPVFPEFKNNGSDLFLQEVNESKEKWVIFVDENLNPSFVMDADGFLRAALFDNEPVNPIDYIHNPIVISDANQKLGDIIHLLKFTPENSEDDVIDQDIILLWSNIKKVITGADILGRLLRGIIEEHASEVRPSE